MDGSDQRRLRELLSAKSRKLLDSIDELHELEEQKRNEDISTPRFHQLADAIDTGDVSINDVASGDGRGETIHDEDERATRRSKTRPG